MLMDRLLWHHLPITSVKFIPPHFILTGEDTILKLYDIASKQLLSRLSGSLSPIHWIRIQDLNNAATLVAYGGRFISVCLVQDNRLVLKLANFPCLDLVHDLVFRKHLKMETVWNLFTISAHNVVECYHLTCSKSSWTCQPAAVFKSTENCILYCALLFEPPECIDGVKPLFIASGTVFNELLLWQISQDALTRDENVNKIDILFRLKEHKGVLFGIDFDWSTKSLCTVSDDRSAVTWQCLVDQQESLIGWQFKSRLRLFGHRSRVWSCRLVPWGVVTVGEDCNVIGWNWDGNIVHRSRIHRGRNVWSMDIAGDLLATGGNDGAICLQTISPKHTIVNHSLSIHSESEHAEASDEDDFPRSVVFGRNGTLFVVTNKGLIMTLNSDGTSFSVAYNGSNKFASYCSVDLDKGKQKVLLGGLKGDLECLCIAGSNLTRVGEMKFEEKIMNALWLNDELHCLISLQHGSLLLLRIEEAGDNSVSIVLVTSLLLPAARTYWWATAACIVVSDQEVYPSRLDGRVLVVGDREGRLHTYDVNSSDTKPLWSIKCHGKSGVTDIIAPKEGETCIYSAGKNGFVNQWALSDTFPGQLVSTSIVKNPGGVTCVQRIIVSGNDLLVFGFHSVDFCVISLPSETCIFSMSCGGSHRSWDFWSLDLLDTSEPLTERGDDTGELICRRFACVAKGLVQLAVEEPKSPTIYLKNSLHGAEINCCATLPFNGLRDQDNLIFTGSEDTNICSWIWPSKDESMASSSSSPDDFIPRRNDTIFHHHCKHISSIRCMSLALNPFNHDIPETQHFKRSNLKTCTPFNALVSAGGRSMVAVWRILPPAQHHAQRKESRLVFTASRMMTSSNSKLRHRVDLRVMRVVSQWIESESGAWKLVVLAASSDGTLSILELESEKNILQVLTPTPLPICSNFCLLDMQLLHLPHRDRITGCLLLTTSTQGHLNLHHVTYMNDVTEEDASLNLLGRVVVCSCGANCLDVMEILPRDKEVLSSLVAIGGDNGTVSLVQLSLAFNQPFSLSSVRVVHFGIGIASPSHHTTAVARVKWLTNESSKSENSLAVNQSKHHSLLSMGGDQRILLWRCVFTQDTGDWLLSVTRCWLIGVSDPHDWALVNCTTSSDDCSFECDMFIVGNGAEIIRLKWSEAIDE